MSLISTTHPKPSSRAWERRKDGLVEVRIGAIIGKSASARHTRGEFTVSAAHFVRVKWDGTFLYLVARLLFLLQFWKPRRVSLTYYNNLYRTSFKYAPPTTTTVPQDRKRRLQDRQTKQLGTSQHPGHFDVDCGRSCGMDHWCSIY